jgi:hypothetical protein
VFLFLVCSFKEAQEFRLKVTSKIGISKYRIPFIGKVFRSCELKV